MAGAFCFVIADHLYAQFGLSFGSDFSPPIWEVCRRMAEQLAEKLFDDDSLVHNHAEHLKKLRWGKRLQTSDFCAGTGVCKT